MNFNFLFKTKSWQSVLAADVHAAITRGPENPGDERRINLIACEATLEHVLSSIGARNRAQTAGKHLITGASARLTLRAAPDLHLNAGVSNFWQKRHGSPDSLAAVARERARRTET